MKNLYDKRVANELKSDLDLRVYTSNLLGSEEDLVLHGGGNTSLKSEVDGEEILFVKGSGWDLGSIKKEGFAPVRLDALQDMARFDSLSDTLMVSMQKEAMIDKDAPNPSVEAILHAIIPFKYVDHTHADAIVTISNSKRGEELIKTLFPDFLIVEYVMPGFILAQRIYELSQNLNWSECRGIILLKHGIFTFDDDPQLSYNKMIESVTLAEEFLEKEAVLKLDNLLEPKEFDFKKLQRAIEEKKGYKIDLKKDQSPLALNYVNRTDLESFANRGVLTPEHIIRTKRSPLVLDNENEIELKLDQYIENYKNYFQQFAKDEVMLNPAPNYAVIQDVGVVSFGKDAKETRVISDILKHTMRAVMRADRLGGYESISLKDSFEMEYWELEQAKLKR